MNSLHVNVDNMFLMEKNCFPKQKYFSEKRGVVTLFHVWLHRQLD